MKTLNDRYREQTKNLAPKFKSYEDSKLDQVKNPTHYFVNMEAWGLGFQILDAEETEAVYDGCSFLDYEDTVACSPINDNPGLITSTNQ